VFSIVLAQGAAVSHTNGMPGSIPGRATNIEKETNMEELQQEKLVCENCGSEDAYWCIDPYMLEVNELEITVAICDECYQKYCDDI